MDEHSGADNVSNNTISVSPTTSAHRRALLFLVQNMRRSMLEEQNSTDNTAAERNFPVPAKFLQCQPGASGAA
jgi:hypothetical protein